MNAIEKEFGAGIVRKFRYCGNVHDRTERIGRYRTGNKSSLCRKQRPQILGVEISVVAHFPQMELRAEGFQSHPGSDVGFMIHFAHDDFVARAERLADGETHQPDERGSVHAERDFAGIAGTQKVRYAAPTAVDGRVDRHALRIAAAALYITLEKVAIDRIEHNLRDLRTRRIIEKDERGGMFERRKLCA